MVKKVLLIGLIAAAAFAGGAGLTQALDGDDAKQPAGGADPQPVITNGVTIYPPGQRPSIPNADERSSTTVTLSE